MLETKIRHISGRSGLLKNQNPTHLGGQFSWGLDVLKKKKINTSTYVFKDPTQVDPANIDLDMRWILENL